MSATLAILLTSALTACGGGGGGDATTATVQASTSTDASTATTTATTTATSTTATGSTTQDSTTFTSGANAMSSTDVAVATAVTASAASSGTTTAATTTSSTTTAATTTAATTTAATTTAATTTTSSTSGLVTTPTEGATSATATSTAASSAPLAVASTSSAQARPALSTGTGFFVAGSKLYDPSGTEFRIRGVNHNHWDQTGATTGIPLTGANTSRIHIDFTQTATTNLKVINAAISAHIVPIPGNWTGTCYQDAAHLSAAVDTWVAQAATWTTPLNAHGLVNIANEWGPANSTVWRDSYITAIARMRAAGYTGTLVVDSGGCGQDAADILNYGAAVLASDPQQNILFDLHVYGSFSEPVSKSHQGLTDSLTALAATGLPVMVGEFGPGNNIGPSPTMVTPQQVVQAAENAGFGWLVWAYDDNDLAGCKTSNAWFGMTAYCATYTGKATDLTTFGQLMVPMLQSMAKPAAAM